MTKYSKVLEDIVSLTWDPMGTFPSVFQSEIHVFGRCAQLNIDRNYRKIAKIAIFYYSKIKQSRQKNRVALYWVLGHTRTNGNDKANLLAQQATTTSFVEPFVLENRDEHL